MLTRRYQNSVCRGNWLHEFREIGRSQVGVVERCRKCGLKKHFPMNIPNHIYLSWHLRSALQIDDPLFKREYGYREHV